MKRIPRRMFSWLFLTLPLPMLAQPPKQKDLVNAVVDAANAWSTIVITGTDADRTAAGIVLLDAVNALKTGGR